MSLEVGAPADEGGVVGGPSGVRVIFPREPYPCPKVQHEPFTGSSVLSQNEKDLLLGLDRWTPVQTERYCQYLLLQDGPPQREDVEIVLRRSLQDFQAKSRAVDVAAKGVGARAWTLGFYVYGNKVGLTSRTKLMPNTVKLLNKYLGSLVSSRDGRKSWAALRVTWGMQAAPHCDRNVKNTENWLVPISRFSGGKLWIEGQEASGSQDWVQWDGRWGTLHGGDEQAVWFDSRKRHAVEAADGDRMVVVAYTPRCLHKCKRQDLETLEELGFPLYSEVVRPTQCPKSAAQIGQDPQYFDISTDSEENSSEGEWGYTGEPKDFDQRVARLSQLVREEGKALIEELEQGLTSVTPGLLAELQEDLRVATLLQEQDGCERELELVRSKFALHRLASVERELEQAWCEAERTGLPQVRAIKVPTESSEVADEPSSLLSVEGDPTFALDDSLVPGESPTDLHPDFGLETPEIVGKGACAVPGALLQTRIVSQAEVWKYLEQWRPPLTDEVVALKDLHRAVWPIGPEELKRLENLRKCR